MNPQSSRPPRPRAAGAVAVTAAALLVAACGGGPSSTGSGSPSAGGSPNSPSAVSYTQCMRSHGVPAYPGPGSSGYLPKIFSGQQAGVSDSQLTTAQKACQGQWPYQPPAQAQQRQLLTGYLKFAQCMRSHGLPGFPGPTATSSGPRFDISVSADGFDPRAPQVLAKAHECEHVLPAGTGLPEVTVSP